MLYPCTGAEARLPSGNARKAAICSYLNQQPLIGRTGRPSERLQRAQIGPPGFSWTEISKSFECP